MLGWFKLHRCLMEKPIFDNPKMLKVFIWCLFKATHKDRDVYFGLRKVSLKPGQFITGRFSASEELKMNGSTAWLYLKTLQDNGTIELNSNNKYTVVNVVNWADYQVQTDSNEQQNDNKISTEYQQNITNKNVKNEKKNNIGGKNIPPQLQEVIDYCKERGNNVDADKFCDFYESKNWYVGKNKMKNWQAAVRTWEKSSKKDEQPTPNHL